MPDYCTCGAQLPPDARFCHKCGKPQYDYPQFEPEVAPEPPPIAPANAKPPNVAIGFRNLMAVNVSFLATLLTFLVIAIPMPPIMALIRFFVCFVAAGYFAVYVYKRRSGQTITVRAGARLGWMTGMFSFVVGSIMALAEMPSAATFRQQMINQNPAMRQFVDSVDDRTIMIAVALMTLMFLFVLLNVLPMVGGVLGAKMLEKD